MKRKFNLLPVLIIVLAVLTSGFALAKKDEEKEDEEKSKTSTFSGLKWRSIGPAFTSGRIADFAVNPQNHSEWFVAVASGARQNIIGHGDDGVQSREALVVVIAFIYHQR